MSNNFCMTRTALVTGGAGFIGSCLTNKLLQNNYNVIVYDDLSNGSGYDNLSKKAKFVKGDIFDTKKFQSICKKSDVIFHMAVKPLNMSFDKPEEVVKINDYGTYIVAKICTNLKRKMIHVSSSEVYGDALTISMNESHPLFPTTIYAGSKAASELYVRGFARSDGLKMCIVRPFNSYGEYMREDTYAAAIPTFYNRISKKLPPEIHGNGKQTRDFSYVEDTAQGIMLADQSKNAIGETFNIGQGKEFQIKDIAKIMLKKYEEITGKTVRHSLKFTKSRKGDVKRHRANISRARKTLGYRPKVSLSEGLENYIRWKLKVKSTK